MTNLLKRFDELLEHLADLEHQRWSGWHLHMVDKQTPENLARWDRQAHTDYKDLSEQEKESDRREVRRYLPLLQALVTTEITTLIERLESLKKPLPTNELKDIALAMREDDFAKAEARVRDDKLFLKHYENAVQHATINEAIALLQAEISN